MAILVKCPDCQNLRSLKHQVCPGCGYNLLSGKKNKKVKYYTKLYISSLKKYKINQYDKLGDAQKAEREFKRLKDENTNDSVIILNETTTIEKLLEWYFSLRHVQQQSQYKKGTLQPKANWLKTHLGSVPISSLKKSMLKDFQALLLNDEPTHSQSYTDQTIGLLKTAVNKAIDDDLLLMSAAKPFRNLKKALAKKRDNARDRILSRDEYEALIPELPYHLKPVFIMGYHTGMRIGEMLELTWDKVSMRDRTIMLEAEDTKEKKPKIIPIGPEVYETLKNLPRGLHSNHVILFRGKPYKDSKSINTTVKRACEKAGIIYGRKVPGGFIPHDLRHTFITNARKAGVPQSVIMEITGHSTAEMFFRYNRVDKEDIKQAIDRFTDFMYPKKKSVDGVK
jgi:integrase